MTILDRLKRGEYLATHSAPHKAPPVPHKRDAAKTKAKATKASRMLAAAARAGVEYGEGLTQWLASRYSELDTIEASRVAAKAWKAGRKAV